MGRTLAANGPIGLQDEALVVASSLAVVGSFFWAPLAFYAIWRKCESTRSKLALILSALLVTVFVPLSPRRSFRQNRLWDAWHTYMSTQIVQDFAGALDESMAHIFVMLPHGIYPFATALSLVGKGGAYFGNPLPVVANVLLRVPVVGQLIQLLGAVTASKQSISRALQAGNNLAMPVGGIAEMFHMGQGQEVALLKRRKGFVKLALQQGVPLVPVYVFGNSMLLRLVTLPKIVETVSRLLRVSLTPFTGRWGLPIPFRLPLLYAVGAPLMVTKIPNPTPAQVDELHRRFVVALVQLFDKYKHLYGCPNKRLSII